MLARRKTNLPKEVSQAETFRNPAQSKPSLRRWRLKFIILPQGDVRRDHEQEHRHRVGGELRGPDRKWIVPGRKCGGHEEGPRGLSSSDSRKSQVGTSASASASDSAWWSDQGLHPIFASQLHGLRKYEQKTHFWLRTMSFNSIFTDDFTPLSFLNPSRFQIMPLV